MKRCCSCRSYVDQGSFNKNKNMPDGLSSQCRSCASRWHKENADRKNKKPCSSCGGKRVNSSSYCRPCSSKAMAAWRQNNRDKSLEIGRRGDKKRRKLQPIKARERRKRNRRKVSMLKPDQARAQYRRKYRSIRRRAVERLGGKCTCCGEQRETMLHIDHINDDGYIERNGKPSFNLAREVLRSKNPFDKYQILCASCNHSKARNGGVCEHKTEDRLGPFNPTISRFGIAA